jgi:hypothetical protein
MRSPLKALAGLVLLLLTGACIVETETTLSDPDPKAADQRLLGTWYHAKGGEVVLFSIAADRERDGAYRVVFTTIKADTERPVESIHYSAWRTAVNGQSYMNVRRTGGNVADMPALTIVSYDLGTDGTLVLRLMEPKQVIAAIEAGKLKGRFKKGRYVDEATITSPRAELAAFIAAADRDALFASKTGALRKLPESPD